MQRILQLEGVPISSPGKSNDSTAPMGGKSLANALLLFIYQLTELLLFGK
jgi:hypothetical protein